MEADPGTKQIRWRADAGVASEYTAKGQMAIASGVGTVTVIAVPSGTGAHYLKFDGSSDSATWRTQKELFDKLIPSGSARPAGLEAGRFWIRS